MERKVRQTGDTSLISKVDRELRYIERAGGFESIFPTEGLTFAVKRGEDDHPYVYKLTGTFAPVNQILGSDPDRFAENNVIGKGIISPNEGPSYKSSYITGPLE